MQQLLVAFFVSLQQLLVAFLWSGCVQATAAALQCNAGASRVAGTENTAGWLANEARVQKWEQNLCKFFVSMGVKMQMTNRCSEGARGQVHGPHVVGTWSAALLYQGFEHWRHAL